jgi:hypothetical protein
MILDRASIGKPRDWRWQRCTEAVQPGGKLRRSDDDGVRRGVSLLRGLRTCSTHGRRRNLARRDPELWAAYQMHMERDLRTAFLEALLRAGTPFEVVGLMRRSCVRGCPRYPAAPRADGRGKMWAWPRRGTNAGRG